MVALYLSLSLALIWLITGTFIFRTAKQVCKLGYVCDFLISKGSVRPEWRPFVRLNDLKAPRPSFLSLLSRSFTIAPIKFWSFLCLLQISGASSFVMNEAGIAAVTRWVSRSILSVVGISLVQKGKRAQSDKAPLLISNHIAPTDILALLALGCCFVAKEGVRAVPGVGRVAASIGCIFVGRDSPDSRTAAREAISTVLKQKIGNTSCCNNPLVIFPEGTTTNGFGLIEFRRGGFEAGVPIQPVRLDYSNLQYSMAMLNAIEHLCYICALPGCTLIVNYLPVIDPKPGQSVEVLAKQCKDAIMKGTKLESYGLESHRNEFELLSFIEAEKSMAARQGDLQRKNST